MIFKRYYSSSTRDFYPSSHVKIFRKFNKSDKKSTKQSAATEIPSAEINIATKVSPRKLQTSNEYCENLVKVQMISKNLHKQLFPYASDSKDKVDETKSEECTAELKRHGINIDSKERIDDVQLKLPTLRGNNIEEHFYAIAKEQVAPYEQLLLPLVNCQQLPLKPTSWDFRVGWTLYDPDTGHGRAIDRPMEDGLVFDVEVCVNEGGAPVLATAVSTKHWYSWVSRQLIAPTNVMRKEIRYQLEDLITLGEEGPKIIVGHNVSYDRARLREQYLVQDTCCRFLDTMSLHVSVSGVTSFQRALLKSKGEPATEDLDWLAKSSLNSLSEVHKLYCGGETISKEPRNIFVEGTLNDVRDNFQMLMQYCASDVAATHRVLKTLYPMFIERFPHPVTLAGMFEMGSAYLPVNRNWTRFIREANLTYEDLNIEAKYHLSRRANEACALLNEKQYRDNLWMWNEDWSTQQLKMKKTKKIDKTKKDEEKKISDSLLTKEELRLIDKFQYLYNQKELLPVRRPLLPGYPQWYRKLCQKPPNTFDPDKKSNWVPGPSEISTGMQISSKLLSLCWEGYPLHYIREHGWGFLVPFRSEHTSTMKKYGEKTLIPIKQLTEHCVVPEFAKFCATEAESEYAINTLDHELETHLSKRTFYKKTNKVKNNHAHEQYKGSGVWCNQVLDDCCFFFKLPHKNGLSYRVGNPLSKDFLNKFSDNVLSSGDPETSTAPRVIEIARMTSYWRNNRDRIMGQMVLWLKENELPTTLRSALSAPFEYGAICPQVVACGTLTRRAMEPTWMTASNSRPDRIGSELRSMVQAPPKYKIIGADVDSQELWIASVLGDAYAYREHGATPLGWMTLSGSKSNGTDMHSVTAKAVGISRDHAKVINYARIYGAGQNFAETLLKQFNPSYSTIEAKNKAIKMFAITKGKRVYRILDKFHDVYEDKDYSAYEAIKIASTCNSPINEVFHKPYWFGGTESAMFNRLEEIASGKPVTPFLGCRLSRALETSNIGNENRFLPTRINWVVQSGAVDFLHLMLVSMRWLMGPNVRFCLSFHDELRYLVKDEFAYKAALAMHITNLYTRSFCASRIGLSNLPMSVAFFSSVEVDSVLRKECTMNCETPSNPHGLQIGYGIPPGESLTIYDAIEKAGGHDLTKWEWLR